MRPGLSLDLPATLTQGREDPASPGTLPATHAALKEMLSNSVRFAVLEPIGDDSQGQRLNFGLRLIWRAPVGKRAGQF